MNKNILRITLIILLLGTFHIIFGFSSQDGEKSGSISKKITETIISKIPQIQEKEEDEKQIILIRAEKIIRKLAHFSIYTVVGMLLMGILETYNLKNTKKIIFSLIIGIIYAASDEFHQSFIPERTPKITDVMIDTMGVMFGILIILTGIQIMEKNTTKNNINQQKIT